MEVDFWLEIAIYFVASSNEIHWRNRRVMADLFCVDWAAIDKTLKGLSKNRVEWFLHVEIENTVGECKDNTTFEPLQCTLSCNILN